jgi:hypothetical protein
MREKGDKKKKIVFILEWDWESLNIGFEMYISILETETLFACQKLHV